MEFTCKKILANNFGWITAECNFQQKKQTHVKNKQFPSFRYNLVGGMDGCLEKGRVVLIWLGRKA